MGERWKDEGLRGRNGERQGETRRETGRQKRRETGRNTERGRERDMEMVKKEERKTDREGEACRERLEERVGRGGIETGREGIHVRVLQQQVQRNKDMHTQDEQLQPSVKACLPAVLMLHSHGESGQLTRKRW